MGKTFDSIVGFFISASVLVVLFFGINFLGKFVDSTPPSRPLPPEAVTPDQELPTDSGSKLDFHTISVIDKPFSVSQDPFSQDEYNKFPRLVIGGDFEEVILRIQGKVTSKSDDVFLILNFKNDGGILKAVRAAAKRLDITATDSKGGIFRAGEDIDVSVNLMKDNLGTTATEFIKNNLGEREFNFISKTEANEVYPLAIIPFMNNGQYGGAEIDSLIVEYACQLGKLCAIATCNPASKYSSVCIQEVFGTGALQPYLNRHPEWKKK